MIPVFPDTKVALKGKRGLIVGIANGQSIAWGCAKAFRALGADLAVTYLNDRAKKHVEPLAQALGAPIFMPLDVMVEGQTERVFERIGKEWGQLDFLLHSIAFSPKEALHGRVVDVGRDGFLKTMDVSCWSFMRMAHLAEPLMKNGGTIFTMTYYGSQMVVENYNLMSLWTRRSQRRRRAVSSASTMSATQPHFWRSTAPSSSPEASSTSTAAITSSIERAWRAPARRLAIVQGDQLGDASGELAVLDLDQEMIVY